MVPVLENQLSKVDTGFTNVPFIEELINQPFFSEITFWDIDTVAVVRTGTSGRKQAITIAVDRKDKIYRISGFGHINEYNKIIEQYPIQIYENNITNICEFYIFLHRGSTRDELYFVNNINKFIKLNKSIMVDSLGYYHPEKNMDNVASRISNVLRNEQFNNINYNVEDETYIITPIVWIANLGRLVKYTLKVDRHGEIYLIEEKTIGDDIGYWYNQN